MQAETHQNISPQFEKLLRLLDAAKILSKNAAIDATCLREILQHPCLDGDEAIASYRSIGTKAISPEFFYTQNTLIGLFSAAYNKSLSAEAVYFKTEIPHKYLTEKYPSQARPIRLLATSTGFYGPRYVAIFPENIVWPKVSEESCPAFYFINKFIDRFLSVTKPAISNNIIHNDNFPYILEADYDEILNAAVSWVHLHEYFHSEGIIPYSKSRMIKSTRSTAALEELRVDILTIIESLEHLPTTPFGDKKSLLLAEFVLAERLIRYPLEAHPNSDYDARSSHVFMSRLLSYKAIGFVGRTLKIDWSCMLPALKSIAYEINDLESSAALLDLDSARHILGSYVAKNSVINATTGKFIQHPLFIDLGGLKEHE